MAPVASPTDSTVSVNFTRFCRIFIMVIYEISWQISYIQSKIQLLKRACYLGRPLPFASAIYKVELRLAGPVFFFFFFFFFFEKDFFVFADLLTLIVFAALSPGRSSRGGTPLFPIYELGLSQIKM